MDSLLSHTTTTAQRVFSDPLPLVIMGAALLVLLLSGFAARLVDLVEAHDLARIGRTNRSGDVIDP